MLSLVVNPPPPPPDFAVTVGTGSQTTSPGGTASYSATVTATGGFANTVTLTATGLPAGASALFTPASVPGAGASTLQIITTAATPLGTSQITITGTSGVLAHSATATLVVGTNRAISIDFVGTGTAMAATETAGVVARTNWNSATGASRSTSLALVTETGAASGAGVTWTSDNTWSTTIASTAGNLRMMKGYLDTGSGHATTVTVTGLAAGTYDIYVYVDGDNGSGTRSGTYQLSGAGITTTSVSLTDPANTNFAGTFTQAASSNGNYVKFSGVAATGFTLTATPGTSSDTAKRAPVNGIQIVPR